VVTPKGIQPAGILEEGGKIQSVVPLGGVPARVETHDCGDAAILPGLVDSHVHINDPGRAEWEGFEAATRAAAARGYTMLVDMPLATTDTATALMNMLPRKTSPGERSCSLKPWQLSLHEFRDIDPATLMPPMREL